MNVLKKYHIPFKGLKQGEHELMYTINKDFFTAFEYDHILDADLEARIHLNKKERLSEFTFDIEGSVKVPCDRCLEELRVNIQVHSKLIVKPGKHFEELSEGLIMVDENEGYFNLAQYIYEYTVLHIPTQNTHKWEECNPEVLDILRKHTQIEEEKIDPRWEQLKELKK